MPHPPLDLPRALPWAALPRRAHALLLCALLTPAAALGAAPGADVQATMLRDDLLRLRYRPDGDIRVETERTVLVGLPPDGDVSLERVEAREHAVPSGGAAAAPGREASDGGPACLGEEGLLRGLRVVQVTFSAARGPDGALLYDEVVADVHLPPARSGSALPASRDRLGDEMLRQLVVNYDQARAWRAPASPRRARPAAAAAAGSMARILVQEEGVYRITVADLEGAGIASQALDPQRLRLLYGGGRPLPAAIAGPAALQEVPLLVDDGGDGRLDADDYLLFCGEPVSRWVWDEASGSYQYVHNLYTSTNTYMLDLSGSVLRHPMERRRGAPQDSAPYRPEAHRVHQRVENEQHVQAQTYGISSGYEWYWEEFHRNARIYPITIHAAAPDSVRVRLRFLALDQGKEAGYVPWHPEFLARWNGQVLGTFDYVSHQAHVVTFVGPPPAEGTNRLGLTALNGQTARLDWYELEYSRAFAAEQGALFFDAPPHDGVVEYHLTGFTGRRPTVLDVSAGAEIVDIEHDAAAGTVVFQAQGSTRPHRYAVVPPERWMRPVAIVRDEGEDVLVDRQGAEYLVITHADFRAAADDLAAWRARDDRFGTPLVTRVVDIQDVYDAFSGGLVDPAALRNFVAFAYTQWQTPPFFVMLVGDGTYDYKNNSGTSPGNWIPAYQDGDSTYDEWFVRVEGDDVFPDLAIGRLPVQTPAEARVVVDKIITYDRQPEPGPWQSRVLLIADDAANPGEEGTEEYVFLRDAEMMASACFPLVSDLQKLYLAQYPREGTGKPKAQAEFLRRFNEGALIITYLGHGNPDVLAHERMFVVSRDLGSIANGGRLPFFYTAASQIGVFDDPTRDSMPEALLKLSDGGVIGMICATRVGYHPTNVLLASLFHRQMYRSGRARVPVGQALMEAERLAHVPNDATGRRNLQRYSLFGDPATRLVLPPCHVALSMADTLRALQEVRVEGQVLDEQGEPTAGEGQALVQAYDSAAMSELEGTVYRQEGSPLFRGYVPLRDGRFTAVFRVPKDITYHGHLGRLSAYVWPGESLQAGFGTVENLILTGTDAAAPADSEGPEIELGFEGREHVTDGARIRPDMPLRAVVRDPSGINVTGATGHEIELGVDAEQVQVTDSYFARDGYRQGTIACPLPALQPGPHDIRLKVWDTHNNSAQVSVRVAVSRDADLLLSDVLFHPNPLRGARGHFAYHWAAPQARVRVRIYALTGRLVDQVEGDAQQGYGQVEWVPPAGLANGTYLARAEAEGTAGEHAGSTVPVVLMR